MWRSPLYEAHRLMGATFVESGEWEISGRFRGLEAEYHAARQTAALVDRTPIGRLRMTGPDALDLLNRLSTNVTDPLPPGSGTTTVLITPKGRIVDWLTLLHPTHDSLTLLTSPETPHAVVQWIDKYTIVEEVTLTDVSQGQTAQLSILGPEATGVVERALGASVDGLAPFGCLQLSHHAGELLVARTDPVGLPGFDVILPSEAAAELWALLMEAGTEAGILPMGEETWEALRVEAGVPRWGAELSERYNPLEANLLESISWDKGCYIGQEVVARLNTYHKVQRYLVGLAFDGGGSLTPGATLTVDGTPAGALTSVAYSPGAGRWLGMGYLRTQYVKQHAEVVATTEDGGAVRGTVIRAPELPEEALSAAAVLVMMSGDEEEEA